MSFRFYPGDVVWDDRNNILRTIKRVFVCKDSDGEYLLFREDLDSDELWGFKCASFELATELQKALM